jgi:hypothetical protein
MGNVGRLPPGDVLKCSDRIAPPRSEGGVVRGAIKGRGIRGGSPRRGALDIAGHGTAAASGAATAPVPAWCPGNASKSMIAIGTPGDANADAAEERAKASRASVRLPASVILPASWALLFGVKGCETGCNHEAAFDCETAPASSPSACFGESVIDWENRRSNEC